MTWIPGVDDVPMSLTDPGSMTVKAVGEATRALCCLRPGARVGIRGPFGRPFELRGRKIGLVAGGIGTPPLAFLAARARRRGLRVESFVGARDKRSLTLLRLFRRAGPVRVATDDGSAGRRGFVTDLVDPGAYDQVYACGPEAMLAALLRKAGTRHAGRLQLSVERYMKCGIGLCGSCDLAGRRVCVEGPVFQGRELQGTELGVFWRDAAGRRVRFPHGAL
jgi:dihydroorotate dehydrogenase electron transfer subunit